MAQTPDSISPPGRRARRILTALLILLLILLPLYLWPLRGAMTGAQRAAAQPGAMLDPRSVWEVARIPAEIWDALMGRPAGSAPASQPKPVPRNLTMISELEAVGDKAIDVASVSMLDGGALPLDDGVSRDGSAPSAMPLLPPNDQGTANGWDGFGRNAGPWGGGSAPSRQGPSIFGSGPGRDSSDPGSLAPTPEPTTILLVGSNITWLGVMAWRRRRRRWSSL